MANPRVYGTPVGIAGGPSERPSSDAGRPKVRASSVERVRAELSRAPKAPAVKKRVRGSSAMASTKRGSNPMLDRIIDDQSK